MMSLRLKRYILILMPALFLLVMVSRLPFHGSSPAVGQMQAAAPAATRITIAFGGDVLMHMGLVQAAKCTDGRYNFAPIFAQVASYLAEADYTVLNLETRLAGAKRGFTGYPCFNSPDSLAPALRDAGIDMLGTANNHSMDKGADGLLATLDALDRHRLAHAGTARTIEEQAKPRIVNVKGVRVAFLNATEMTNGIPVPAAKPYIINLIGDGSALIRQAADARADGADLVIAFLHFGSEYQRQPSVPQQLLAKKLLANGVDTVIGAHPHVVQPIKRVTVQRGNTPYTGYIAYSLGNFVSNQRDRYRDSGIVVYLDIEKTDAGTAVSGVRYLPVYVHKGQGGYRALPLPPGVPVTSDMPLTAADASRARQVRDELAAHLARPTAEQITPMPARIP